MSLNTQVLNLNHEQPDIKTRHRVKIKYVRDSDLKSPVKPLIQIGSNSLKRLDEFENGYFNVDSPDDELHGSGCLLGESAGKNVLKDSFNRRYTGHWVVKPGREVNTTLITDMLNIPYDTSVHYIAIHLHLFAESLELKDITSGETVFKSKAGNLKNRIGLDRVEYYSSPEGLTVYKDHEYRLISTYNNTTDTDQDSVAVIYMYAPDREYQKPNPSVANILSVQPSASKPGGGM